MTNMYSLICIKCMIYDLLLNCKNTTATIDIRTSDKTGTVMAIVFLKKKKTLQILFINHQRSFHKKIKKVFFSFFS